MTPKEALLILEAMADGCSPLTGEVLPHDHLLLDESVMEAVLIAIEAMRGKPASTSKPTRNAKPAIGKDEALPLEHVDLPDDDLFAAVALYRAHDTNPTANRIAALLCGAPAVKIAELVQHPLFAKYAARYQKAQIVPWLDEWILKNNINPPTVKEIHPYFAEPHYNKLSERAVEQLKEKVVAIPIVRVEGLSEELIERRKSLPRSHEPWPDEETRLLKKAIEFTNDVAFLSQSFGRSELAISAQAEKWLSPLDTESEA